MGQNSFVGSMGWEMKIMKNCVFHNIPPKQPKFVMIAGRSQTVLEFEM